MKKLITFMVALYLAACFTGSATAAMTEAPAGFSEGIAALETAVYGQEKSGPYVDRINALETTVFGNTSTLQVPDKIARLNKAFFDNGDQASIPLILRFAEDQLLHKAGTGPVLGRVERLEETLNGKHENGALNIRLEKILKTVFASGTVSVRNTKIPGKTLVKINLLDDLNSDKNKSGDTFRYEVASDVYVGNVLVIPAGIQATGHVEKAKAAGRFGRQGKLDLSFGTVPTLDDSPVSVSLGDTAREENKHVIAAAGASVFGAAILGPIGLIGGAFIEGKTLKIPAGTEFYVEVNSDTSVKGAFLEAGAPTVAPSSTPEQPKIAEIRITK